MMNPNLKQLHAYPFEKLNRLNQGIVGPCDKPHIALSIGEPKHPAPDFIAEVLANAMDKLSAYPATKGLIELRQAIADWLTERFALTEINADTHILPVNGTREALFAFTQAVIDAKQDPLVLMPNPFYQIYEGAALLAEAQPYYLNCLPENGFIPDYNQVPESVWQRCQLLFICSPGNPTGAVTDSATLQKLIHLADQYDFIIASDECYSEIYFDEQQPPTGLLQACAAMGRHDYKNCMVFHSLSKRSNLPGLRSGFVAGDSAIISDFLRYRTYHGCAMPIQHQLASIAAWQDEQHVIENRQRYREKFKLFEEILGDSIEINIPPAGFYLWPNTPVSDETFAQQLLAQQHITCLPGRYLARECQAINPGENYVRMALVAPIDACRDAALRIKEFLARL